MVQASPDADYNAAVKAFAETRDLPSFVALVRGAIGLLDSPTEEPWRSVDDPDAFLSDFYEVRVTFDRELSADEISRASGALGYALRATLAGESLSDPTVALCEDHRTVLEYGYDATKSQRDDPDFDAAFLLAHRYIEEGTPVRKTDRAGKGTQGTRLVEGIGGDTDIRFFVR
jgi:hypothetical protein